MTYCSNSSRVNLCRSHLLKTFIPGFENSIKGENLWLAIQPVGTFVPNFLIFKICCSTREDLFLLVIDTLRKKCPNTEFFLVLIFPYSDWIRRDSPYSVRIRENKNRKKLRIWTLFTQCGYLKKSCNESEIEPIFTHVVA